MHIWFVAACAVILACGCSKKNPDEAVYLDSADILSEVDNVTDVVNQPLPVDAASAGIETTPASEPAAVSAVPFDAGSTQLSPKNIQRALKGAGLYNGKIDGVIGPKTKKAIRDFQAQNGLVADGKVGAKTWDKLKKSLAAAIPE